VAAIIAVSRRNARLGVSGAGDHWCRDGRRKVCRGDFSRPRTGINGMSVIDAWRATEVAPTNRLYGSAPTFQGGVLKWRRMRGGRHHRRFPAKRPAGCFGVRGSLMPRWPPEGL